MVLGLGSAKKQMKNLLLFWLLRHPSGLELLWMELVGSTGSSFGNFKGPLLASLRDTYWDVPGFCEFSAPSLGTQINHRVDGRQSDQRVGQKSL